MLKQRYNRAVNAIHADEELIDRTLEAAIHRQTKPAPISAAGQRLIIGFVCTLVIIVALLPRLVQPHQDILTSNGEVPDASGDLLPLSSDDPPLSVNAVQLGSDTEQGITMTVMQANLTEDGHVDLLIEFSGEKVNESALPYFYSTPLSTSGQGMIIEYEKPNAILWRQRGYADVNQSDWYTNSGLYTVTMHQIALGRYFFPTFHTNLDLTTLPIADSFENTATLWHDLNADEEIQMCLVPGDPIIQMDKGMAITAFGFTEDGRLIIQNRSPMNLLAGEGIGACLVPKGYAEDDWHHWVVWTNSRLWIDEDSSYCYCENIYPVTIEELGSYTLRTYYYTVEEVLKGDWTVTVDVNNLTPQTE